jgi:hypothetical protein
MLDLQGLFSIYAELSLVLAGFVGVVSAFAGRTREYRPVELIRLTTVLGCAGAVLAGCLVFFASAAGGFSVDQSLSASGAASCALVAVVLLPLTQEARRRSHEPDSTTERWVLIVVPGLNFLVAALYAYAIIAERSLFLLIGGFSIQLLLGLWIFSRLLMRQN